MKKIIGLIVGIIVVVIIVAILLFLGPGMGFGKGNGQGDGESTIQTQSEPISDIEENEQNDSEVIIIIKEDIVSINDKEFTNAEDLKEYMETIISDTKTFVLDDTLALQSTYEWAMEVFDELKIPLKKE